MSPKSKTAYTEYRGFRLPKDLVRRLRLAAKERGVTQTQIVVEGIEHVLRLPQAPQEGSGLDDGQPVGSSGQIPPPVSDDALAKLRGEQ